MKQVKVGGEIVFKGYGDDVPEAERVLEAGKTYKVTEVNETDEAVSVEIPNPDFNPKKKETSSNSKMLSVDVFDEEFDLPKAKGAAAAKGRTAPAKAETKAPAKAAGKGAKAAPAKADAKGDAEEEGGEGDDEALTEEDADIVKLVEETDDILALATELVEEQAANDYRLGGVLYHIRLDKAYEKLDKRYRENGGFELYVQEKLNIEYRKAMYLVKIYYNVNKFGIDPAKITEMGWTKASKIVAVMDEENADELVELATESTVADLVENIKSSYTTKGGTKGEKKRLKTFKFKLFEDQAEGVQNTLEAAAESLGLKDLNAAFEHIVMEWAVDHPLKKKTAAVGRQVAAPKAAAKAPAKAAARARR